MTTYYRSALIKYDGYFNASRYFGELTNGIYLLPLDDKDRKEIENFISLPVEGNKIVIWVDEMLLAHRNNREKNNEYFQLMQQINIFCKVYIAAHVGVARPSQYKYTAAEAAVYATKKSLLSADWVRFSDIYFKYKLLFRLFSVSTLDNQDYIFSVMNSTIALEGLLLRGEKAENAYKLRVRGAFLLGKNQRTRTKYYTTFKLAYELRSAVAHANDKEKTRVRNKIKSDLNMTLKEFNEELIKINRILLQELISDPSAFDDLDQIVLKS